MSTDGFQQQVSAALSDLADDPVPSPPLFERVALQMRRRRRRRVAGSAAAFSVVGALAAGGVLLHADRDGAVPAGTVTPPVCPARNSPPPSPTGQADLTGRLVPGTPAVATICRFHGYNQAEPYGSLARTATLRDNDAASLAAAFDEGAPVPPGPRSCPPNYGDLVFVEFTYRDGATVTVRVNRSGCPTASNGRFALSASALAEQRLTELVGRDRR